MQPDPSVVAGLHATQAGKRPLPVRPPLVSDVVVHAAVVVLDDEGAGDLAAFDEYGGFVIMAFGPFVLGCVVALPRFGFLWL